jgi:hypothetical protein
VSTKPSSPSRARSLIGTTCTPSPNFVTRRQYI